MQWLQATAAEDQGRRKGETGAGNMRQWRVQMYSGNSPAWKDCSQTSRNNRKQNKLSVAPLLSSAPAVKVAFLGLPQKFPGLQHFAKECLNSNHASSDCAVEILLRKDTQTAWTIHCQGACGHDTQTIRP